MLPNVCCMEDTLVDAFIMRLFSIALLPVKYFELASGSCRPVRLSLKTSCNPVWALGRAYRPDIFSVSLLQYVLFPLLYIVRNNLEVLMTCILNWILFPFASIAMLFNLVKGMFVSGSMCVYHKSSIEYFSTLNRMFLLHSYIKYFFSRCENSLYINAAETL